MNDNKKVFRDIEKCNSCSELRGQIENDREYIEIICLCDGIKCPKCGKNKIHRPISNSYDIASGEIVHHSAHSGMAGCKQCRETDDLIEPKKGFVVSKYSHLGPPLVLIKPQMGETAQQFSKRLCNGMLKALENRKNAGL